MTLPSGLQTWMFGSRCDQSLEKATLPCGLQILMFGSGCDPVEWPSGLDIWLWHCIRPEHGADDPAEWPADLDVWQWKGLVPGEGDPAVWPAHHNTIDSIKVPMAWHRRPTGVVRIQHWLVCLRQYQSAIMDYTLGVVHH